MRLEPATGGITLCEEHLRRTLADCPRFRAWCGADNQAQALARIHFDDLPAPEDGAAALSEDQIIALRPFALIETGKQGGYSRGRVATETYVEAGLLWIVLEAFLHRRRLAGQDAVQISLPEDKVSRFSQNRIGFFSRQRTCNRCRQKQCHENSSCLHTSHL